MWSVLANVPREPEKGEYAAPENMTLNDATTSPSQLWLPRRVTVPA